MTLMVIHSPPPLMPHDVLTIICDTDDDLRRVGRVGGVDVIHPFPKSVYFKHYISLSKHFTDFDATRRFAHLIVMSV